MRGSWRVEEGDVLRGHLVEVGDDEDELGPLDRVAEAGVGAEEAGGVVVGE
ncbi:hypothetical protein Srufu_079020 (plasmid) [Streptomyces libani subsp. rufus]|nr:hypothetical protein Srufu_079020 [Streptomyces libani subsp. rufus]